jgi:hypothetical protein
MVEIVSHQVDKSNKWGVEELENMVVILDNPWGLVLAHKVAENESRIK